MAKSVVAGCSRCTRIKGPHYALPEMPPLPADRVTRRRAFEATGVDYPGPTHSKRLKRPRRRGWSSSPASPPGRPPGPGVVTVGGGVSPCPATLHLRLRPTRKAPDRQWRAVPPCRQGTPATPDVASIEWLFIGALGPWQGGVYERLGGAGQGGVRGLHSGTRAGGGRLCSFVAQVAAHSTTGPSPT